MPLRWEVASGVGYGAIGGAISALTANEIAIAVTGGQGNPTSAQLAMITAATTLLSGGVAAVLGQNAAGAVNAAANETENNTCAPGHDCGTLKSAIKDTGRAAWNTALGTIEAVPNLFSGALPGYPDYVPFLQGAMLPYDDPDFGSLVSAVGSVGLATLIRSRSASDPSILTSSEIADGGKTINVNPADLRWTQTTAGGNGRADALRNSMAQNGYAGPPIDVVRANVKSGVWAAS